jgi:hypothetical protein
MQRLFMLLCAATAAPAGMLLLLLLPVALLLISRGVRLPLRGLIPSPLLLGQPVGQVPAVRLL